LVGSTPVGRPRRRWRPERHADARYLDIDDTRVAGALPAGPTTAAATAVIDEDGMGLAARLDALLVQPEVEWLVLGGEEGEVQALLRSFATGPRTRTLTVPGLDEGVARAYDTVGRLVTATPLAGEEVTVPVEPGGFTVIGGPDEVTRLSGPGRIETAIAISRDSFRDGEASAVILARADAFPDAPAGTRWRSCATRRF
jgi:hypothetical protein